MAFWDILTAHSKNIDFFMRYPNQSQNVVWLVLDSCVDFIFIADVFINFLTTIVAENGETVDDRNIIQEIDI